MKINAMWNKTKQRSRRSPGAASFTGFEKNNVEPLLQSSQDLLFREIVSQYTLTLLNESIAIDYSWKLSKVGFEWTELTRFVQSKERKKFTQLLQNKFNVLDYSTLFILTCHVLTDLVQVIEGKII